MKVGNRILISRTDSIGDVVLTLPLAVALKNLDPANQILFLGRGYTQPVIKSCPSVDEFYSVDELRSVDDWRRMRADIILHVFPKSALAAMAKKAGIPKRIGTSHRFYHWWTCTERLNLGRKNSDLHEAQLNLKLGAPLGLKAHFSLDEIRTMQVLRKPEVSEKVKSLLVPGKVNLILHPRSKGSAREWGLSNYSALIKMLPTENFHVMVSGTAQEGSMLREWIAGEKVTDITGKLSLPEFMQLISVSDALVAASTGPLHLAAALGIQALGIYAPMRPIHIGRWGPLGSKAMAFALDKNCSDCRKSGNCHCIREVEAARIADELLKIRK
ncbi:MAG: glycosyltransferase family 9 protein [Bacteroidia bacterium]|nr:glycosyltransferase family 9 protein [Bacteroidia bacterium]